MEDRSGGILLMSQVPESGQPKDLLRLPPPARDDGNSTLVAGCSTTPSRCWPTNRGRQRASVDKGLPLRTLACWWTGCARSGSRASPSTWRTLLRHPTARVRAGDTPGHVQYTRNTVTGASTAEWPCCGGRPATGWSSKHRRHAAVIALLRVPRLVLAVNKIGLVGLREPCSPLAKDFRGWPPRWATRPTRW